MGKIGHEIIRLTEVDSTNRYFMDWLLRERPEEGTVVITGSQTAGKGTDGSVWESERGLNLTFSFILYPSFLAPGEQFYLNKAVSLGMADIVSECLPGRDDIRIKWPNDIYIGNHKLAGTLIQNGVKGSVFDFSVIGIGLNVNQVSFRGDAPNPISLKMSTGQDFDLDKVLLKTLEKIENRYDLLKKGMNEAMDIDYLEALYRFNMLSGFVYQGNQIIAKITGVNRYGQLILEIPGEKIMECDLKEIVMPHHLAPSPLWRGGTGGRG
jgi:BirA family transcriptional regulator, biotin operon repressor / biotin---[acetyl-CoA-carboxylase] ligase